MQISCPQCATIYELDERLLPPGGAKVQCTRCSHVFTAAPPQQREFGKTQIFGGAALAGSASAPSVGALTGTDDARAREERPASGDRTQIYGKAKSAPVPGPMNPHQSGTVLYGRSQDAAAASRTMQMFGAAAQQDAAAASRTTQMFGAAAQQDAAAASRTTQMFGATPQQDTAAASRTTQMFGSAPQQDAAAASRTTQMFGSAPQQDAAAASRTTQMFGAAAQQDAAAASRTTQMFGSAPQQDSAAASRTTQMFGTPSAHDAPTLTGGPIPGSESDARAQPFAAPASAIEATSGPRPGTPVFGAPERPADSASAPAAATARRMTGAHPFALEPFEPPSALRDPDLSDLDDPARALRAGLERRRNIVLGAIAVVVILFGGILGYRYWSSLPKPTPPEAISAHARAVIELRRDDTESIQNASVALADLVKKYPDFIDARASYLTALLFQLDDVRMEIDRLQQRSTQLNAEIARLKEKKATGDWENRVNALIDQIGAIKRESDPLVDRATSLDAEVNTVFRAMQDHVPARPTREQELQLVRAQALYFGVKGSDQAIQLSERYKLLGGTEGWDAVAYAEYALNTKVAPETRRQAREGLEALEARDASFVRLHVLVGRLALADKIADGATRALEAAVTLNPKHDAAKRLLKQLEQQQSAQVIP